MEKFNAFNPEKASTLGKHQGETYHEITERPKVQYFTSMLLRGGINASQIVKEGDVYFSHQQNLQNIENKRDALVSMEADRIILKHAFYYHDHGIDHDSLDEADLRDMNFVNIVADDDVSKYSVFDFGKAFMPKAESKNIVLSEKVAEQLLFRTNYLLANNFAKQEYFDAVLKKSDLILSSDELKKYFEYLGLSESNEDTRARGMFQDIQTHLKSLRQAAMKYLIEHRQGTSLKAV